MSGYWAGLVEGVQGRREAAYQENFARAQQNRQMADRVFQYLLASRDPQIQQLALGGLMQPAGGRKKGLAGFLGEVGSESDPILEQIVGRMNEQIPDEGQGGGPSPPIPGSAAMSPNQPVRPGSQPLNISPAGAPMTLGGADAWSQPGGADAMTGAPPPGMDEMGGMVGMAPPAPPESPYKRRGTGVPTAEEIAESTAVAQQRGRLSAITTALQGAQVPQEQIQDALLGAVGAPQRQRNPAAVSQWGVKLPGSDVVQPVIFDPDTAQYVLSGRQPIPQGAEMVRMTGSNGSVPRSAKEPDPGSPTGWSKVFYDTETGQELYRVPDTPFVPPPALSGTFNTMDANQNNVVRGITRGGAPGPVLGVAPGQQASPDQSSAEALLVEVDKLITSASQPRFAGAPRRPLLPAQLDQITQERAAAAGLPYTTYQQLVAATKLPASRQVQPPAGTPAGTSAPATPESAAERVRRRALANRSATTPPPAAPARGRGAGPGPAR